MNTACPTAESKKIEIDMRTRIQILRGTLCITTLLALLPMAKGRADDNAARWEPAIQAFEKLNESELRGEILFVGSSSIRAWDTERHFPSHHVINRGFGGSQMSDVLHYWDRIVTPLRPRLIVLYEGDNDIAKGESAAHVAREFEQLVARLVDQLPECQLVFLSIKPSLKRWKLYPEMKRANDQIEKCCAKHPACSFVDVSRVMLGDDGKPLPTLFVKDGLHLNDAGYEQWTKLVQPYLDQ